MAAGTNTVTFAVPMNAVQGTTFARFRLTSAGGLAATGEAADGEVEDYAVTLNVPTGGTAVLIDDPTAPGKKVLVVTSTTQIDNIQLQLSPGGILLCKRGCKIAVYQAVSIGRIVVLNMDANDTLQIDPQLKVPVQTVRRKP